MMTLIIAAAVAAQPPVVPMSPPAEQAPMMQMGDHPDGQHASKDECCCKDMMAMMHGDHGPEHKGHSDH